MEDLNSKVQLHQSKCPYDPKEKLKQTDANSLYTNPKELLCKDDKCCIWQDLQFWFGYQSKRLSEDDFQNYFRDSARNGSGLYEKLVVLGGKFLFAAAEMFFLEDFDRNEKSKGILCCPVDFKDVPLKRNIIRFLYAQKRNERIVSQKSLFKFGKCYLKHAQKLDSEIQVAQYVKACIGYCCHTTKLDRFHLEGDPESQRTSSVLDWLFPVVKHIYWIQGQHQTEKGDFTTREFIQDLQAYLGYRDDKLLPRIIDALQSEHTEFQADTQTGEQLLHQFTSEYFKEIAALNFEVPDNSKNWIEHKANELIKSDACAIFGCVYLNLIPLANKYAVYQQPPDSSFFDATFKSLLASCWVLSGEQLGKVWLLQLVQRLRQIQLVTQLSESMGDIPNRGNFIESQSLPIKLSNFWHCPDQLIPNLHLFNLENLRFDIAGETSAQAALRDLKNSSSEYGKVENIEKINSLPIGVHNSSTLKSEAYDESNTAGEREGALPKLKLFRIFPIGENKNSKSKHSSASESTSVFKKQIPINSAIRLKFHNLDERLQDGTVRVKIEGAAPIVGSNASEAAGNPIDLRAVISSPSGNPYKALELNFTSSSEHGHQVYTRRIDLFGPKSQQLQDDAALTDFPRVSEQFEKYLSGSSPFEYGIERGTIREEEFLLPKKIRDAKPTACNRSSSGAGKEDHYNKLRTHWPYKNPYSEREIISKKHSPLSYDPHDDPKLFDSLWPYRHSAESTDVIDAANNNTCMPNFCWVAENSAQKPKSNEVESNKFLFPRKGDKKNSISTEAWDLLRARHTYEIYR